LIFAGTASIKLQRWQHLKALGPQFCVGNFMLNLFNAASHIIGNGTSDRLLQANRAGRNKGRAAQLLKVGLCSFDNFYRG
jgi:hypothetical protein